MYAAIITNETTEAHTVKMVDWRTGKTWTERTTETLCAIPPRYTPLVLDMGKIAAAQQQAAKIMSDFGRK